MSQSRGLYYHECNYPEVQDTMIEEPINRIGPGPDPIDFQALIVVNEFSNQNLKIRFGKRFKFIGHPDTRDLGLNKDYPSYYGKFKKKGDTLTFYFKKSVQHFNKAALKRKVVQKLDYSRNYTLGKEGRIETAPYCYWFKAVYKTKD
ncbi:MAG: hypothetical protein DCO96_10810 [Fluviicola sp. XM-24bin1]|nr:MAG: hypothetical protein DCO96_10810 [Fluviicola sp. XM-24bin1]